MERFVDLLAAHCEGNAIVKPTVSVVSATLEPCPTLPFLNTPPCQSNSECFSVIFWDLGVALAGGGGGGEVFWWWAGWSLG